MLGRTAAAFTIAATIAGCGGAAPRTAATGTTPATPTASRTAAAPPPAPKPEPHPHPRPRPRPDPGKLPQTQQLPSATTRAFRSEMTALWNGVQHDSAHIAMPAYFPESAYVQVKAIGDAAGDWQDRLVRDYALDLSAAHALLGADPHRARLIRVIVPSAYAHWVEPGACYNRVGYYEVPNSRVVYRLEGEVRSFGIASMISWRGVWYVVHLGSIIGPSGVVDDPSAGEGESTPSSTC